MYVAIVKRAVCQDDEFYAIVFNENGSKLRTNDGEETYIDLSGKFHRWTEKFAVPKRTLFRIVKSMPEYNVQKVNFSEYVNKNLPAFFIAGREVHFFKITKK